MIIDYTYEQVGSTGVFRQSIKEQTYQSDKTIAYVRFYGITRVPVDVKDQDGQIMKFTYEADRETLTVFMQDSKVQVADFEFLELDLSPGSPLMNALSMFTN